MKCSKVEYLGTLALCRASVHNERNGMELVVGGYGYSTHQLHHTRMQSEKRIPFAALQLRSVITTSGEMGAARRKEKVDPITQLRLLQAQNEILCGTC